MKNSSWLRRFTAIATAIILMAGIAPFNLEAALSVGPYCDTPYLNNFGAATQVTIGESGGVPYVYVAGVNSNQMGLTFVASQLDLEAGDTMVITGRTGVNFPPADRSMMVRRSVGGWHELEVTFTFPNFTLNHQLIRILD